MQIQKQLLHLGLGQIGDGSLTLETIKREL